MKSLTTVVVGVGVLLAGACGPATGGMTERAGVSARSAALEGWTRAATWDENARLRWMEGESIAGAGLALPGTGVWRLHYTAPGRTSGLVVTVGSFQTTEEERAPVTPPDITIGDREVGDTWVDSPEVMGRVLAVRGAGVPEGVSMLLVPADRLQWIVTIPGEARRWRLDATTGEIVTP